MTTKSPDASALRAAALQGLPDSVLSGPATDRASRLSAAADLFKKAGLTPPTAAELAKERTRRQMPEIRERSKAALARQMAALLPKSLTGVDQLIPPQNGAKS
jgi:hypothetical protein